jgi:hypothetical protein
LLAAGGRLRRVERLGRVFVELGQSACRCPTAFHQCYCVSTSRSHYKYTSNSFHLYLLPSPQLKHCLASSERGSGQSVASWPDCLQL